MFRRQEPYSQFQESNTIPAVKTWVRRPPTRAVNDLLGSDSSVNEPLSQTLTPDKGRRSSASRSCGLCFRGKRSRTPENPGQARRHPQDRCALAHHRFIAFENEHFGRLMGQSCCQSGQSAPTTTNSTSDGGDGAECGRLENPYLKTVEEGAQVNESISATNPTYTEPLAQT